MFKEKYTVKITIDDQTLFLKDYTTYQAILDDFPVFETTENVRTCKRMLEKQITPTYKKAQKYKYIQVELMCSVIWSSTWTGRLHTNVSITDDQCFKWAGLSAMLTRSVIKPSTSVCFCSRTIRAR